MLSGRLLVVLLFSFSLCSNMVSSRSCLPRPTQQVQPLCHLFRSFPRLDGCQHVFYVYDFFEVLASCVGSASCIRIHQAMLSVHNMAASCISGMFSFVWDFLDAQRATVERAMDDVTASMQAVQDGAEQHLQNIEVLRQLAEDMTQRAATGPSEHFPGAEWTRHTTAVQEIVNASVIVPATGRPPSWLQPSASSGELPAATQPDGASVEAQAKRPRSDDPPPWRPLSNIRRRAPPTSNGPQQRRDDPMQLPADMPQRLDEPPQLPTGMPQRLDEPPQLRPPQHAADWEESGWDRSGWDDRSWDDSAAPWGADDSWHDGGWHGWDGRADNDAGARDDNDAGGMPWGHAEDGTGGDDSAAPAWGADDSWHGGGGWDADDSWHGRGGWDGSAAGAHDDSAARMEERPHAEDGGDASDGDDMHPDARAAYEAWLKEDDDASAARAVGTSGDDGADGERWSWEDYGHWRWSERFGEYVFFAEVNNVKWTWRYGTGEWTLRSELYGARGERRGMYSEYEDARRRAHRVLTDLRYKEWLRVNKRAIDGDFDECSV